MILIVRYLQHLIVSYVQSNDGICRRTIWRYSREKISGSPGSFSDFCTSVRRSIDNSRTLLSLFVDIRISSVYQSGLHSSSILLKQVGKYLNLPTSPVSIFNMLFKWGSRLNVWKHLTRAWTLGNMHYTYSLYHLLLRVNFISFHTWIKLTKTLF